MQRVVVFRSVGSQRDRWVGGYRWAVSQPSWIVRLAVIAFLLVVAVPLFALIVLAALAAAVVGGVLLLANAITTKVRGLFQTDGRSNVRVIRRRDGSD